MHSMSAAAHANLHILQNELTYLEQGGFGIVSNDAVTTIGKTLEPHVWLKFADGLTGEIDLADHLWGPVFAQLRADTELDTVVWPNGADFAPEFLYERLQRVRAAGAVVETEG